MIKNDQVTEERKGNKTGRKRNENERNSKSCLSLDRVFIALMLNPWGGDTLYVTTAHC